MKKKKFDFRFYGEKRRALGSYNAVMMYFLISTREGEPLPDKEICEILALTKAEVSACRDRMIELGAIDYQRIGCPMVSHYWANHDRVEELCQNPPERERKQRTEYLQRNERGRFVK